MAVEVQFDGQAPRTAEPRQETVREWMDRLKRAGGVLVEDGIKAQYVTLDETTDDAIILIDRTDQAPYRLGRED